MILGKKPTALVASKAVDFDRLKKEASYIVRKAVGHRSITQFASTIHLIDPKPIVDLIKMNYKELPDRNLLRKIASASEGRVSYQLLYSLFGYSEHDPEEDRSWAKWIPQWGSVYMCDLGIGEDCLQGGQRPVLVIQNDKGNQHSPNVCILPISSKCKFSSFFHILLEKELGFEKDSWAFAEMPMTISKRRFFYNSIPYKITTLPENKMDEIKFALEKQLGFEPLMFDEDKVFSMIEKIKNLQENIRVKKSNNLIDILNEKVDQLIDYCNKYHKNYQYIIQEYDRINNYAYEAI